VPNILPSGFLLAVDIAHGLGICHLDPTQSNKKLGGRPDRIPPASTPDRGDKTIPDVVVAANGWLRPCLKIFRGGTVRCLGMSV